MKYLVLLVVLLFVGYGVAYAWVTLRSDRAKSTDPKIRWDDVVPAVFCGMGILFMHIHDGVVQIYAAAKKDLEP